MNDAPRTPRRFDVALEGLDGISGIGPSAFLYHEPTEDEEITLEDGTRAIVTYMSTGQEDQPVIRARRLPEQP